MARLPVPRRHPKRRHLPMYQHGGAVPIDKGNPMRENGIRDCYDSEWESAEMETENEVPA